jgi:nucleoside-diphosphate-sugar epimerase
MAKLIFGCGYLGERVAKRWRAAGHDVIAVTRRDNRAERLRRDGFVAIVADVTRVESLRALPTAETVLFAVGYDRSANSNLSEQTIEDVYAGGVRNVLAALPTNIGRFIYISTTGVYGPASGQWVDESTPPDPQREGGRASLAAEGVLTAHPLAARGTILRLAGMYGPGRVPFIDKLRNSEPIPTPVTGYLNLIHVDDAATVVLAAEKSAPYGSRPRVYCVSDGQPVERGQYYSEVARQIGAPLPRFIEPDQDSRRAARAESNRRVRNERMLAELRVTLAYPDYRAGLAAILPS